jgi:glutamate decarboxylase
VPSQVPEGNKAIGAATTGSSEAILLGGLALKKRWQAKRKAEGKSIHEPGPNIVLGAEAHCSLEKFTRYFDVRLSTFLLQRIILQELTYS